MQEPTGYQPSSQDVLAMYFLNPFWDQFIKPFGVPLFICENIAVTMSGWNDRKVTIAAKTDVLVEKKRCPRGIE